MCAGIFNPPKPGISTLSQTLGVFWFSYSILLRLEAFDGMHLIFQGGDVRWFKASTPFSDGTNIMMPASIIPSLYIMLVLILLWGLHSSLGFVGAIVVELL